MFTASQIYDFDNDNGRSNIHVQQWVSVPKSNVVQLDYTVTSFEASTFSGDQAMPVAFLQPVLNHAHRYSGTVPWTGAPTEEVNVPVGENQLPPFDTAERWIAWIGNDGRGLALYAPSDQPHEFWTLHRVYPQGSSQTHVLSHTARHTFVPGVPVDQRHYVIYGALAAIRATVYEYEGHSWFQDVSTSNPFFPFINTMLRNDVTAGCAGSPPLFCPAQENSSAQMAVFLLTSKRAPGYVPPPATGTMFNDVPATHFAARWIEQAARDGIMLGCGGGNFCPNTVVTRRAMAGYLLRAKEGGGYVPPPAIGVFQDVPVSDPDAPWIEEIYRRGITGGCATNPLRYCPGDPNTRGQMSVFLTVNFGLN